MRDLNLTEVARIARLYIDGDAAEQLLLDKTGHTDYDFEKFYEIKCALMRAEKINPDLKLSAILWMPRVDQHGYAEPVVCASVLPCEGWQKQRCSQPLWDALNGSEGTRVERADSESVYFPVYNTDHEAVAALELLSMHAEANDI